ncbi:MAG: acyltransferase [Bariatricus sp.]
MKKRVIYFDLLNITASFGVVAMHCNGIVHSFSNTIPWKQSLIVEVAAYWAVPVFFMLSGATLMEYRSKYTTEVFLKKRAEKTLIPFIAWSILALIFKSLTGAIAIKSLSVRELLSMFINCKIENIYWFFIPLFAVYLCIPVLACLIQDSYRWVEYMIVVGIATISIAPFLCNVLEIPFNTFMSFPLTGGYVLYVLLGFWLSKADLSKNERILIYLLGIVGAFARYCGTYFLSIKNGELNKLFWGYLNWPALLLAVAVFVWFRYHDWNWLENNSRLGAVVIEMAGCSFGVYLTHIFVINIVCSVCNVNVSGGKWRTLGVILVYGISLIVVKILKRIPVIQRVVP